MRISSSNNESGNSDSCSGSNGGAVGPERKWEWSILTNILCCGSKANENNTTSTITPSSKRTLVYRVTDWLISKPGLLAWIWTTMGLTIFFGRDAFLAHVFTLTGVLLIILYKINSLYGNFENPHYYSFLLVFAGGALHTLVPVIGTLFQLRPALFTHLGICLLVHVLHLSQCYAVFNDIAFTDEEFIVILWLVNVSEMLVNAVFVFNDPGHHGFSENEYIACGLTVEVMTLMIVNLKLRGGKYQNNSDRSNVSVGMSVISNDPSIDTTTCCGWSQGEMKLALHCFRHSYRELFNEHLLSRLVLMSISALTIALMTLYSRPSYLTFMVYLTIFMPLAVLKIKKTGTTIPYIFDKLLMIIPLVLLAFALATEVPALIDAAHNDDKTEDNDEASGGLHHIVGTILTLITFNIGFGILFFIIGVMTNGTCHSVRLFILFALFATVTSMLHLLRYHDDYDESTTNLEEIFLFFACLTITTGLVFFLTKMRVMNQRDYSSSSGGGSSSKGNIVSNSTTFTGATNGTPIYLGSSSTDRSATSSRIHPTSIHVSSTHTVSSITPELRTPKFIYPASLGVNVSHVVEIKDDEIMSQSVKSDP